ncbi:MAG: class I SAM-dependent methyltransferase [Hyphomicrobiaceae bacterium]
MQQTATFWDKVADKYAKSPIADIDAYNNTLGRTRTYLKTTDRVLEIGCGTGSTALLLAPGVEHIVASDISTRMIEIASRKAADQGVSNVTFTAADLFDSALDQGPYDAVLAFNLLHLVEDAPGAIRHIHGLLKPGGVFISKTVCQPGKGAPLKFRLIKLLLPLMQWLGKAPYVNFMTPTEFEALMTAQGFKVVESGDRPPPSRYIVAMKS